MALPPQAMPLVRAIRLVFDEPMRLEHLVGITLLERDDVDRQAIPPKPSHPDGGEKQQRGKSLHTRFQGRAAHGRHDMCSGPTRARQETGARYGLSSNVRS